MLYLLLTIASSFFIGNILKLASIRGHDTTVIIAANYIFAAILGFVWWWQSGGISISSLTIMMGVGGGILWPGAFFVYVWGLAKFGVSISGTLSRLALIVPVLFGLIFLREPLTLFLLLGLLFTVLAFYFLSPAIDNEDADSLSSASFWLFVLLLIGSFGMVLLWSNLFTTFGNLAENTLFLIGVFAWSIPFAWLYVWWKKLTVTKSAVFFGLLVGIPNFLATYGILNALQSTDFIGRSAIAYTLQGGANALLIFLAGAFFWRESVQARNYLGLLFALSAIICLNL